MDSNDIMRTRRNNALLGTIINEGGMPHSLRNKILPYKVRPRPEVEVFDVLIFVIERGHPAFFVRAIAHPDHAWEFSFDDKKEATIFKLYFG
jgi:hypothetical protein